MCTLTWWQENDRYGVLFNRDESVKRAEAEPPAVFTDGLSRPTSPTSLTSSTRLIRPTDPDGGGTWIWVNEAGMIACVLNNYTGARQIPEDPVSRGLLLTSLVSARSVTDFEHQVHTLDYRRYRGFLLFGFDGERTVCFSWDGEELLRTDDAPCPITTSGFLPDEVVAYRKKQFRLQVDEPQGPRCRHLEAYHTTHNPDFPAHSVLMARTDARTVSHSRIMVEQSRVNFSYTPISSGQQLEPVLEPALLTTLEREN